MKFTRTKSELYTAEAKLSKSIMGIYVIYVMAYNYHNAGTFNIVFFWFISSLLVIEIVVTSITTTIGAVFKVTAALVKDLFKEQQ